MTSYMDVFLCYQMLYIYLIVNYSVPRFFRRTIVIIIIDKSESLNIDFNFLRACARFDSLFDTWQFIGISKMYENMDKIDFIFQSPSVHALNHPLLCCWF